jgi:ADP-dependent NAD(P)H-hydrate dehydratase
MKPAEVDEALLRSWPLPQPEGDGDKEGRGRVLIVAGSREMPGAAVLAAHAAMRAGAGKMVIAAPASVAHAIGMAVLEARVIALDETAGGGICMVPALSECAGRADAILVGPGMIEREATLRMVEALIPVVGDAVLVLDALAMDGVMHGCRLPPRTLLTPHAGEMAHLLEIPKEEVQADPGAAAARAAHRWKTVVACKGAATFTANSAGQAWLHHAQVPGLGVSGSGDVLAGLITGLAARGATVEQAAVWGVALHAAAGSALAARTGTIGYLASELATEVPALMQGFSRDG